MQSGGGSQQVREKRGISLFYTDIFPDESPFVFAGGKHRKSDVSMHFLFPEKKDEGRENRKAQNLLMDRRREGHPF